MDEVYFNSVLIGRTGSIEPLQFEINGVSTWRLERFYEIPNNCIRWDSDNVIAIRVYDYLKTGGIWYGPIGIATRDAHINYLKNRYKTN